MNDADTIAERDWLSYVADQGERGQLGKTAYIGPARFTGESDYRIGSLDADRYEAEFGKWDTARQEQERAAWMATQPEPRFPQERDWMMGQIDAPTYHKAFDAWAAQQVPAEETPTASGAVQGDVSEYDLLDSGAGGFGDDKLAQETKGARFPEEAQYIAGHIGRDEYLGAFVQWGAQQGQQDGGDGLLVPSATTSPQAAMVQGNLYAGMDGASPPEALNPTSPQAAMAQGDLYEGAAPIRSSVDIMEGTGSDLPGYGADLVHPSKEDGDGPLSASNYTEAAGSAWDWMTAKEFDADLLEEARTRGIDPPKHGNTFLERLGAERLPDPGFNATPISTATMQQQIAVSANNLDAPDRWRLAAGGELGKRALGVAAPPYTYLRHYDDMNTGEKWLYGAATGAATLGVVSGGAKGLGVVLASTKRGQTTALSKTNRMLAGWGLPPMSQKEYNSYLNVAAKTPAGGSGTATLAPEAPVRVAPSKVPPAVVNPFERPTVVWTPPAPKPWALPGPAAVQIAPPGVSAPGPAETPTPRRSPSPEFEGAPEPGESPEPTRTPSSPPRPEPSRTPEPVPEPSRTPEPMPEPPRSPELASPRQPEPSTPGAPGPMKRAEPTPVTTRSPAPARRSAFEEQTAAYPSAAPALAAAMGEALQPAPDPQPIPDPVKMKQQQPETKTKPLPVPLAARALAPVKTMPARRYPRRVPPPTDGDVERDPVLPAGAGRFPRQTQHNERVRVTYDSVGDSFSTEMIDYDDPQVTGWDMSPPQQTARQVGGLTLTPKRRGVTAAHDGFEERAEIDLAIQQELRHKAQRAGGGVVEGEYDLSFRHDIDAGSTSAVYDVPPQVKAQRRDALIKDSVKRQAQQKAEDLKGQRRKKRKKKLNEYAGELPGVTIARPPPLKEANPLRK